MPHTPALRLALPVPVLLAVLGAALGGLLVGFACSLSSASRQFEHALIAERQAALVTGIARDADAIDAPALARRLGEYRDLIVRESDYLPARAAGAQSREAARAERLAMLARAPADRAQLVAMVRAIAASESAEVAGARAALDGTRRHMLVLGVLLACMAMAAAAIGAAQLRRANRDLSREVDARTAELRAVDRSRRLFFAKASHELRTPVTAMRSIAEVALAGGGEPAAALADVVAQAGFLGHRIEELLALASAEEGRPVLTMAQCDAGRIIADAVAQALPYARSVGVQIRTAAPSAPVTLLADARWLGQALLAIIDNGLKFSDPGGELAIRLEAAGSSASIAIEDHGPGLLPRELPRIFDAYYQAEAGRARGGSGLGLALARWVVEQHGGSIHAENRDGGGCAILIELALPPL
ncbi:MAG TPA: HAMP domain-containing sensor histidine kinase [Novosphingobium sp.]|nr:HAMP domain-containing sensor histidine kinase [Novosphingobium sp.]